MDLGKVLTDVSEIRVYSDTNPLFSVNPTWGVEELIINAEIVDGSTILYDPKNNTNLFCLPNHNSVKYINSLDSYETIKTITGCTLATAGGHFFLHKTDILENEYYIELADYDSTDPTAGFTKEIWTGAGDNVDVTPSGGGDGGQAWNTNVVPQFNLFDNTDSVPTVKVKYTLLNEATGKVYDLSNENKFLIGNNSSNQNQLTLWVNQASFVDDDTSGPWTLIGSSIVSNGPLWTGNGPAHIRTKTLKSIVDYRTDIGWQAYFSTVAEDSLAGYYKVTLKNANVSSEYNQPDPQDPIGHPNWSADWPNALSTVGVSGPANSRHYFDDTYANLPREYVTSLGVSDVKK